MPKNPIGFIRNAIIAKTVVAHMKKLIFSIITALGFITDEYLTFEYVCDYPERGPKFYGFPFVQQTDSTWIFSMSGDIYLFGFLGNLIFWTIIIGGIVLLVNIIEGKWTKKIIGIFGWLIFVWSLFISFVHFAAVDWRLEFTHDNFKNNYYQSVIDCERNFIMIKKYK
ncbi:MAG: hypothetical protein COB12_10290 [Flavobacterium sp.]|nr:MAG: hypothetical protein COB12_10290 [Flavobacterium sp.]